jgi:hypothetical protein
MCSSVFARSVLGAGAALILLAGCSGGSQAGGAGAVPQGAIARALVYGASSSSGDLVYLSTNLGSVYVFTYPGGSYVGTLNQTFDTASGLCSDKAGNVFVTSTIDGKVYEFAHGDMDPVATLDDSGNYPNGCAVDQISGDLAVAGGNGTVGANVAVFKNASGSPTVYRAKFFGFDYCTYDNKGNIFADGDGIIQELSNGSSGFTMISLNKQPTGPGAIQWDGKDFAVGDWLDKSGQKQITVYRVKITGTVGKVIKIIKLRIGLTNRPAYKAQFWLTGDQIVSPKTYQRGIGIWNYPAGGAATGTVTESFHDPRGVTVSLGSP